MGLLNLTLPSIGQPNSTEDVDVVNAFSAIQTVLNGNLDGTNAPALEAAFSTWKTIQWGSGLATNAIVTAGGVYGIYPFAGSSTGVWTTGLAAHSFYLEPSDYTAGTRTTRYRLRAQCIVNGAAPTTNIVPGLYPVTSFGGGAGSTPTISALGTVIAGSTITFTTPALSTNTVSTSTEFTAPAAGAYAFALAIGGGFAASSQVQINVQLQMRQV
jgi:hypothetical protein